jgi:hypothetical protein
MRFPGFSGRLLRTPEHFAQSEAREPHQRCRPMAAFSIKKQFTISEIEFDGSRGGIRINNIYRSINDR